MLRVRSVILICLVVFMVSAGHVDAAPSYHGFDGLNFIPTADVQAVKEVSMAYSSKPARTAYVGLAPYTISLSTSMFTEGLEFSLTNALFYPVDGGNVLMYNSIIPVPNGVKFRVLQERPVTPVSIAIGMATPYGLYFVVSSRGTMLDMKYRQHYGFSTSFAKAGLFWGFETSIIPRMNLLIETMGQMAIVKRDVDSNGNDVHNELFYSLGIRYKWTPRMNIDVAVRKDWFTYNETAQEGGWKDPLIHVRVSYTGDLWFWKNVSERSK